MNAFISATQLDGVTDWTRSSKSGAAGHCVEVAEFDGGVALRNSNDRDAGALKFTDAEMSAFVAGAKNGDFDRFLD